MIWAKMGRKFVEENFDWEIIAKKFKKTIKEVSLKIQLFSKFV